MIYSGEGDDAVAVDSNLNVGEHYRVLADMVTVSAGQLMW